MDHPRTRGLAAVLIGATLLGLAAPFVKWAAAGGASDLAIGFFRMLFGLPGAIWLASQAAPSEGDTRRGRMWAMAAGAAFFADLWGWHLSMRYTTAANATLLAGGLAPVWVTLFSALALGLRPGWLGWIGQALGLGGALLLALAKGARVGSGMGEALAVLTSVFYGAFTLLMARARRDLDARRTLAWMVASCLACFLAAALLRGEAFRGFTPQAWMSLVGLGLIIQLLAWWLNSWGLGHIEASLGAIALQMQQVATLFLGWILLREPLRPLGLVGASCILAGIVMASKGRILRKP